jgi:transcriptional regulator with XRE-family HTH domain
LHVPYNWDRLARAIVDAREEATLTQEELADLAGVARTTVQNLEGLRTFTRWPRKGAAAVETALGKPRGWAREIATEADPASVERTVPPIPQNDPQFDEFYLRVMRMNRSRAFKRQLVDEYLIQRHSQMAPVAERLLRLGEVDDVGEGGGEESNAV